MSLLAFQNHTWPSGGASFSLTQESDLEAPSPGASDETFSAMAFGAADADRDIYVACGYVTPSDTVGGMTIGGVAATLVVEETTNAEKSCIWKAAVPTGTSGDVVVERAGSGTFSACSISVYRVVAGTSGATSTEDNGGTTMTLDVNVSSGASVIAIVQARNGSSWNGNWSAALTQDANWDANSNEWFSAAHGNSLAGGAPQALSVTCSSAGAGDSGCIVVIDPD